MLQRVVISGHDLSIMPFLNSAINITARRFLALYETIKLLFLTDSDGSGSAQENIERT
jgi:hypothetical protein